MSNIIVKGSNGNITLKTNILSADYAMIIPTGKWYNKNDNDIDIEDFGVVHTGTGINRVIKFPDGTMIQTGYVTSSSNFTITFSPIFVTDTPAFFYERTNSVNSYASWWSGTSDSGRLSRNITNAGGTTTGRWMAIGKWK